MEFRVDYPCLDWRIVSYSGIGGLRLLDPRMNQSINPSSYTESTHITRIFSYLTLTMTDTN